MPRLVDHDARRAEIVAVTCRLIAARGLDAVTMREIAAELGMANGALARYFPGKNAIIGAAFRYVFDATNERIASRLEGRQGLDAVHAFWAEVVPVSAVAREEARIVLPFWHRALTDAGLAAVYSEAISEWRWRLTALLRQAEALGEIAGGGAYDDEVEHILVLLAGLQVHALFVPEVASAADQDRVLEVWFDGLRARRPGPGIIERGVRGLTASCSVAPGDTPADEPTREQATMGS